MNVLDANDIIVTKAERIGKKVQYNNYRRHIKVTLETNKAKKLKEKQGGEGIFISPDLTKKQQASDKTMRDELRRRDDGERNLV